MCFRPAEVGSDGAVCPSCGKKLQSIGGIQLKKCPMCGADLAASPEVASPGAPAAPAAPAGGPAAPKPPSAPKA